MHIRILKNQNTDILKTFLSSNKSECMFICSNLETAGIEYNGELFQGEYWGAFNNDTFEIEGILVHYWNGNIMMFAPESETLRDLTMHFKSRKSRPIAGVVGPDSQANIVIEELGISNESYNLNSTEGLYELDLKSLKGTLPSNFSITHAKTASKSLLTMWMRSYEIEALGTPDNFDLDAKAQEKAQSLMEGNCWILLQDNIPVSLSGFNAKIDDMVQIGPVWTPPEHRNQGYARLLVHQTLLAAKEERINKAILFTLSPAAVKAYESIGFKKIGNYRLALLKNEI